MRYTAGQDATEQFYSLHLKEVLERAQYKRLIIGTVAGEEPSIASRTLGAISKVPYAEPTWLTSGYHSPYYSEVGASVSTRADASNTVIQNHRKFQQAMRAFTDEWVVPDAEVSLFI